MSAPLRSVPSVPSTPSALTECSDDQLMLLAQRGHRPAFDELGQRHTGWLLSLASKLAGSTADAEEVVQEVWISVWNQRERYYPDGRLRGYLLTLTRNRIRKHHRTRRRHPTEALDLESLGGSAPEQLQALLDEERSRRLLTALEKLEPGQREALVLRYAEELAYEEIATLLASKPATLRVRVHGALVSLRRLFHKGPDR